MAYLTCQPEGGLRTIETDTKVTLFNKGAQIVKQISWTPDLVASFADVCLNDAKLFNFAYEELYQATEGTFSVKVAPLISYANFLTAIF